MFKEMGFCMVWYAIEILTLFLIIGVLNPGDSLFPQSWDQTITRFYK